MSGLFLKKELRERTLVDEQIFQEVKSILEHHDKRGGDGTRRATARGAEYEDRGTCGERLRARRAAAEKRGHICLYRRRGTRTRGIDRKYTAADRGDYADRHYAVLHRLDGNRAEILDRGRGDKRARERTLYLYEIRHLYIRKGERISIAIDDCRARGVHRVNGAVLLIYGKCRAVDGGYAAGNMIKAIVVVVILVLLVLLARVVALVSKRTDERAQMEPVVAAFMLVFFAGIRECGRGRKQRGNERGGCEYFRVLHTLVLMLLGLRDLARPESETGESGNTNRYTH